MGGQGMGSLALPDGTIVQAYEILQTLDGEDIFGPTYLAKNSRGDVVDLLELAPTEFVRREGLELVPRNEDALTILKWARLAFVNEAQILRRLQQPALIRVIDVFEANGAAYCVTEHIESGVSLASRLRQGVQFGQQDLIELLVPILDGLAQAHAEGFMHRDIEPRNVIFRADHSVVLVDFGAARNALRFKSRKILNALSSGYAAPEQYSYTAKQGPWTDVYGLAAVAYRVVAGVPPIDSEQRRQGLEMMTAVEAAADDYDEAFLAAIDWGLRLDPGHRPAQVGPWKDALLGRLAVPAVPEEIAAVDSDELMPVDIDAAVTEDGAESFSDEAVTEPVTADDTKRPRWQVAAVAAGLLVAAGAAAWKLTGNSESKAPVAADSAAAERLPEEAVVEEAVAVDTAAPEIGNLDWVSEWDAGSAEAAAVEPEGETVEGEATSASAAPSSLEALAMQMLASEQADREAAAEQAQLELEQQQAEAEARQKATASAPPAADSAEKEAAVRRAKALEAELVRLKAEQAARAQAEQEAAAAAARAQREAQEKREAELARQLAIVAEAKKNCRLPAADLSADGMMTYERALSVTGALRSGRAVRLPPVVLPNGREVTVEVTEDSCARIIR